MRIFVSFRPAVTNQAVADRFKTLLLASKAFDDVVLSPEAQAPRSDYASSLAATIARCDAFIAIISPGWAEIGDAHGRLINNPADPVRLEITTALDRIMPMVPVLVDGATLPDASEITRALQGLTLRDSVAVSLATLDHDFARLLAIVAPGTTYPMVTSAPDRAGPKPPRSSGLPRAATLPDYTSPSAIEARQAAAKTDGVPPATEAAPADVPDLAALDRETRSRRLSVLFRRVFRRRRASAAPSPEVLAPRKASAASDQAQAGRAAPRGDTTPWVSAPARRVSVRRAVPLLGLVVLALVATWLFLSFINDQSPTLQDLLEGGMPG